MTFVVDGTNGLTFPNSTTQASAGVVLQVVNATYSTAVSNATTTFVDTGLTATITPKFTTSKILVWVTQQGVNKNAGHVTNSITIKLLRGATDLGNPVYVWGYMNSAVQLTGNATFQYMDSPATTSATTYKTQFNNSVVASLVTVQLDSAVASTIILMEIAA